MVTSILYFSHNVSFLSKTNQSICSNINGGAFNFVKSKIVIGKELTFSKSQLLDSFKLKELADHNLEFHENGGKFSKRFENASWKRPLFVTSNFFFYKVLKRLLLHIMYKDSFVLERVNP